MAVEIEKLIVTLEARLDGYNKGLTQAQTDTNRKLAAMEARYQQMASRLKASASSAAMGVGGALAGIGAMLSIDKILEYADAWTRVRRALEQNEKIFGTQLKSAEDLNKIASETRQDLEAISKLYIRTSNAVQEMGRSNDDAAMAVESFAKALVIGQASANEQRGALEQFSQALQKGKLDGDEFRTIMETAGVVQEALAKQFNVSRGSLLAMARTGKLTGKDIVEALIKIKPVIDEAFKSAPVTVGEGFTILNNAITQYIGKLNEATKATDGIGAALKYAAMNMDTIAGAAFTVGAALLTTFGGGALSSLLAFAKRLATLPAMLAGAATAAVTFGNSATLNLSRFNSALQQGASLSTALDVAMRENAAGATTVADQFKGLATVIGDDLLSGISVISEALTGQSVDWNTLKAGAILAIGAIVGGVKSAGLLVASSLKVIPLAAEIAFKEMANKVISILNYISRTGTALINKIYGAMNELPGFDMKMQTPTVFAEFDLDAAYSQAADLSKSLTSGLEENFDLTAFANRVQSEADKIAIDRLSKEWKPGGAESGKPRARYEEPDERGAKRFAREMAQAEGRIKSMQAEIAVVGQSELAIERAKIQQDLLNKAKENGIVVGGKEQVAILALADATARTNAELAFLQKLQSQKEAGRALRDEISLMGLYGSALTEARVKQELLNEAKRLGRELLPWEERKIEATARETAELEYQRDTIREVQDASKEMLSSFVSDMRQGVSATEALGNALGKLADRLVDAGLDQLITSLVGGAGASLFGGAGSGGWSTTVTPFAKGGIARNGRAVSLPTFARGGISRSAAIFGEAGPEAAVPLPDGRRIPVDLRLPNIPSAAPASGASQVITVAPVFNVQNGTPAGIEKLKTEVGPMIVKTVNEMFDRSSRFARTKI